MRMNTIKDDVRQALAKASLKQEFMLRFAFEEFMEVYNVSPTSKRLDKQLREIQELIETINQG